MQHFQSHQLRRGRFSEPGRVYLLTSTTRNRTPFFEDFQSARCLPPHFAEAQHEGSLKSLAWVIMPDHIHWLVELRDATLATVMRRFKSRSRCSLYKIGKVRGQLWQAGYHDRALRRGGGLESLCKIRGCQPNSGRPGATSWGLSALGRDLGVATNRHRGASPLPRCPIPCATTAATPGPAWERACPAINCEPMHRTCARCTVPRHNPPQNPAKSPSKARIYGFCKTGTHPAITLAYPVSGVSVQAGRESPSFIQQYPLRGPRY